MQDKDGIHFLESIGDAALGVEKESKEMVVMITTEIGVISASMSMERALQLGIALVRYSGRRYRFKQENPPVVGPPPESRQESDDAKASSDTGGGAGPEPDLGQPGGRPAGDQGEIGGNQGGGQDRPDEPDDEQDITF